MEGNWNKIVLKYYSDCGIDKQQIYIFTFLLHVLCPIFFIYSGLWFCNPPMTKQSWTPVFRDPHVHDNIGDVYAPYL